MLCTFCGVSTTYCPCVSACNPACEYRTSRISSSSQWWVHSRATLTLAGPSSTVPIRAPCVAALVLLLPRNTPHRVETLPGLVVKVIQARVDGPLRRPGKHLRVQIVLATEEDAPLVPRGGLYVRACAIRSAVSVRPAPGQLDLKRACVRAATVLCELFKGNRPVCGHSNKIEPRQYVRVQSHSATSQISTSRAKSSNASNLASCMFLPFHQSRIRASSMAQSSFIALPFHKLLPQADALSVEDTAKPINAPQSQTRPVRAPDLHVSVSVDLCALKSQPA